jgi:MFS family permease
MTYKWRNSVFPIAAIFSFRMLGLFMLIPIFTLYASQLSFATPALMGFALGAYGLSQGILQIPFGMLSDRYGRKKIISLGLILFVIGSLVGAFADSIYQMIFARILQGMGAVGGVLIALLADLTPDKQRTKAMAVIGITIGTSFSVAMIISPSIANHYGLAGIFYVTAFLAMVGLFLLHCVIPNPEREIFTSQEENQGVLIKKVLKNANLLRFNISIFIQHMILTATFFVLPLILKRQIALGNLALQWHFYLPIIIFAFFCMIPFILFAEKKEQMRSIFLVAVGLTGISQFLLYFLYSYWGGLCGLFLGYFLAFNILEAIIPSLVSRHAGSSNKGTAMGVYSTSQFLGIFIGGVLAGLIYQYGSIQIIFLFNSLVSLGWFLLVFSISPYAYEMTITIPYQAGTQPDYLLPEITKLPGVNKVKILHEQRHLHAQVNKALYQDGSIEKLLFDFDLRGKYEQNI